MAFVKGQSGNAKGRPRGSQNKVTGELRDRLKDFLDGNFDKVQRDFKKLDHKDRIEYYEKFLKYVLPQLRTTDLKLDFDNMTESQIDEIITKILNRKNQ